MLEERKSLAERYFRGVYGGQPAVIDELAGEEIVSTYPIFEKLHNTPAIRGRDAMKAFVTHFGSSWADAHFTIHEAIAEEDRVVLMWSFRARWTGREQQNGPSPGQEQSWGGITLFCFDEAGKIVAEIGEESAPGPFQRLAASETANTNT